MSGPLKNEKHERFCQALVGGETLAQAYVTAGYKPNEKNAARLKKIEGVTARIAELQEKAADMAVLTAADIARQLDEDRAFAKAMEVPGAMVAATMGKAKVLGLIVDKTQHTGAINITISQEDAGL
jgi:phage terminase small subunit